MSRFTQQKSEDTKRFDTLVEAPLFITLNRVDRTEALKHWSELFRAEVISHAMGIKYEELKVLFAEHNLKFPNYLKELRLELHGKKQFNGLVNEDFKMNFMDFANHDRRSQERLISTLMNLHPDKPFSKLIKAVFNCEVFPYFYNLKRGSEKNPFLFDKLPKVKTIPQEIVKPEEAKAIPQEVVIPKEEAIAFPQEIVMPKEEAIPQEVVMRNEEIIPTPHVEEPPSNSIPFEDPFANSYAVEEPKFSKNNVTINVGGINLSINGVYSTKNVAKKLQFIVDELNEMSDSNIEVNISLSEKPGSLLPF